MKSFYKKVLGFTLATTLTGLTIFSSAAAAGPIHKVRPGESLWSIARKYNTNVDELARINGIKNSEYLEVGMELELKAAPKLYEVKEGESFWSISRKFGISYVELVKFNGSQDPDRIYPGMKIKIPTDGTSIRQQRFSWPTKARISSYYGPRWGRMHEGIDFAVPIGRNIRAAAAGKVVWGGWIRGYGRTVIIQHTDGYRTLYAHNSRVLVHGGDRVKQGQVIAKSGNSGRSTGPHLHFEIQKNGNPVNPMNYLK